MAKKKKSKKRFQKPAASATPVASAKITKVEASMPVATAPDPRWGYVARDVRRTAVLAAVCIGIELILWVILDHTGVGPNVYDLIKL